MAFHRNLPVNTERDILDMIAKALMLRAGGGVELSPDELRSAADLQAEIAIRESDGTVSFRVERQ